MQRQRCWQVRQKPSRFGGRTSKVTLMECPGGGIGTQSTNFRKLPNACRMIALRSCTQVFRMLPQEEFTNRKLQLRCTDALKNEEIAPISKLSLACFQPRKTPNISGTAQRLCTEFACIAEACPAPGGARRGQQQHVPFARSNFCKDFVPIRRVQQI